MKNLVEVVVFRVLFEPTTRTNLVLLKDQEADRFLPMAIGSFEAEAIARALQGITLSRPLTHDLLNSVITRFGGKPEEVVINDLLEDVFYARLIIRHQGAVVSVDARPSDSICLATLAGCPIYVSAQVMDRAAIPMDELPEISDDDEPDEPPEGFA